MSFMCRCANSNASCHRVLLLEGVPETRSWDLMELFGCRLPKVSSKGTDNSCHKMCHAVSVIYCEKKLHFLKYRDIFFNFKYRLAWLTVWWFLWMSNFSAILYSFSIPSFIIQLSSWANKTTPIITHCEIKSSQILI